MIDIDKASTWFDYVGDMHYFRLGRYRGESLYSVVRKPESRVYLSEILLREDTTLRDMAIILQYAKDAGVEL